MYESQKLEMGLIDSMTMFWSNMGEDLLKVNRERQENRRELDASTPAMRRASVMLSDNEPPLPSRLSSRIDIKNAVSRIDITNPKESSALKGRQTMFDLVTLVAPKRDPTFIHPRHTVKIKWDIFVGGFIVYSVLAVPYSIAFDLDPNGEV